MSESPEDVTPPEPCSKRQRTTPAAAGAGAGHRRTGGPSAAAQEPSAAAQEPTVAEFCGEHSGLSLEGILHCLELFAIADDAVTTSDVCHAHIKPATVPAGWIDEPELIDIERRWYKYACRWQDTGERQSVPPAGMR